MWQVHEQTCLELWRLANNELFDGALKKEPAFRVWDAGDCAGHFHAIYGSPVIEIHEELFSYGKEHEILEVIVHEMVHQLQWESRRPIGHDAYFSDIIGSVWDG